MKRNLQLHTSDVVSRLAASLRYHVTPRKDRAILGVSVDATKVALNRLTRQELVASPAGEFYAIVPFEAAAVDVIDYQDRIGWLDHTATVLSELAERVEPEEFVATAKTELIPVSDQQELN